MIIHRRNWTLTFICLVVFILVSSIASAETPKTLVISGFDEDDVTRQYLRLNPEVRIQYDNEKYLTEDSLINAILTRDYEYDIFTINSDWGLAPLGEKGYYSDLSSNEEISLLSKEWYPQIQEALTIGTQIIAYPIALSMEVWGVDPSVPLRCPLITQPHDFISFIQSLEINDKIREEYDMNYVIEVPEKERLMKILIQNILLNCEQNATQANFENDDFILCVEAIRSMAEPSQVDEFMYDTLYKLPTYLSMSEDLLDPNSAYTLIPPPPLMNEQKPTIETLLTVMIVNPNSKNIDLAMDYLQFRATHENPRTAYLLSPKSNLPIENPEFQSLQIKRQEEIDRLSTLLNTTEVDKAYELRERIELLKTESLNERSRWSISQECIDSYYNVVPFMFISKGSPLLGLSGERLFKNLTHSISRYLDYQIDAHQLVKELNTKVDIIYAEVH